MKTKMPSLGRGLSALIPGATEDTEPKEFRAVPVDAIAPNPLQPRRDFDMAALKELADSISEQGVLQPILVEELEPGVFQLLAGERRLRASKIAGLVEIPARVLHDLNDGERGVITLMENLQREDLNAIEFAIGCQRVLEETGWKHEELAKHLGRARPTVTNTLRLLTLPSAVQESIRRAEISEGHGRALLGAQDKDIPMLWRTILEQNMNVRQTELLVQNFVGVKRMPRQKAVNRSDFDDPVLRSKLEEKFGCIVTLTGNEERGKIVLTYTSDDHRKQLIARLILD